MSGDQHETRRDSGVCQAGSIHIIPGSNAFTVQYRHLYNLGRPDTALFVTHCLKPSDVLKEGNHVTRFYRTISQNN